MDIARGLSYVMVPQSSSDPGVLFNHKIRLEIISIFQNMTTVQYVKLRTLGMTGIRLSSILSTK